MMNGSHKRLYELANGFFSIAVNVSFSKKQDTMSLDSLMKACNMALGLHNG